MQNFLKVLLSFIVFNNICFGSALNPFDLFKSNIIGKTGIEVYDYITPKLNCGIDYQIEKLQKHMINHGHWGYKTSISKRNTVINWPTFFIDQMMNLINSDEKQKAFIVNIWNSKLLVYACDIPGCLSGVCLNGIVPNVQGIIFEDQSVERPSIGLKDIAMYSNV